MSVINWQNGLAYKFTLRIGTSLVLLTVAASVVTSQAMDDCSLTGLLSFGLVLCLIMAGAMGYMTHCLLSRPLTTLVSAAKRISQGDYNHPLESGSDDEMGQLAKAIEQMRLSVSQTTRQLKESRQQFQTLFEQVPCYISVQDKDFKLVAVNSMFDRDFDARIGEYCYRCYKGVDHRCINCAVEKSFADGKVHSSEETVTHADGSKRYILNLTAPILDAKGDIIAVMEMGTDVTEIRHLEDELIKSEKKYRLFFNNDPNCIFVFDRENHEILDANERVFSDFGYGKEELMSRSFEELVEPADLDSFNAFLNGSGSFMPRLQMIAKSGRIIRVNLRASFGEHLGHEAVIASTADISDVLEAEEQLVQAAKMATLGEMSAGIAHELNQPLSVLATSARILTKQSKAENCDKSMIGEVAGEVAQQVERSTKIINHLREFGRKSEIERTRLDLLDPLKGVFQLMGQQLRVHNIKVELDAPESLPLVWGEQNRLEQVFINLVLNARDSIEEMRLARPALEGRICIQAGSDDASVWARISDNGVGIPESVQAKVFEPFFTTKEVGKGTGLGLSISYGIVRDYGGVIELQSQPGGGASFTLKLPQAEKA
jgi:histidine kinase